MKLSRIILTSVLLCLVLLASDSSLYSGLAQDAGSVANKATDDLLDYEWPQFTGDSSFTRFSAGPAPEASDILWKANVEGIQSYISAFNSMVFVSTKDSVYALDKDLGRILWHTTLPKPGPWPAVYKIDDSHLVAGSSCLDPYTGQILWTSNEFSANPEPLFVANVYSPEEQMFYVKSDSHVTAWDFSDPSNPPHAVWTTYVSGGGVVGSGVQYGDGKVFPGSFEPHQMALDAKTGYVVWDVQTKSSMLFSGSYYQGSYFRSGTHDNTLYCFDSENGEIKWTYCPETEDGYFCIGPATAYGTVYALNRDGYLYALDADTADVVWKYEGPGPLMFPGNPTVADGKVYATTGQAASYTSEYTESEFVCLDAYTGTLLWRMPIEAFAPRESVAIAYGNLYMIPGNVTTAVDTISGDEYSTVNQVWAIGSKDWPMWRRDPAHSAIGQSGPSNLALRWKFETGGAVISSPTAVDGRIYAGSHDGNLYCLNARSGSLIWSYETSGPLKSTPAVVNGRVFVGPDDGYVYCLDAINGDLLWKADAGGYVPAKFAAAVLLRSSPIVVDNWVYVGSLDTNLYCLNAADGEVLWKFKTEGYITSSPAVSEGAVYIVSQEPSAGGFYKLDAISGELIWKKELTYQKTAGGGTDMHASPTVANGMVFASSNVMEYYGINATNGEIIWTYRNEIAGEFIVCSTIYQNGRLFLIDKFSVTCVNASDGNVLWGTYLGDELYVSPAFADEKLYVVTDERHVYAINATNGEKLDQFEINSNSWSAPIVYEGRLYFGSHDWNIYCLADFSPIESALSLELSKIKVNPKEDLVGFGSLNPGVVGARISVTITKPDGSKSNIEVETNQDGGYEFDLTPEASGIWLVKAQWITNKGYYASANSQEAQFEVTSSINEVDSIPFDATYLIIIAALVVVLVSALVYVKYRRS